MVSKGFEFARDVFDTIGEKTLSPLGGFFMEKLGGSFLFFFSPFFFAFLGPFSDFLGFIIGTLAHDLLVGDRLLECILKEIFGFAGLVGGILYILTQGFDKGVEKFVLKGTLMGFLFSDIGVLVKLAFKIISLLFFLYFFN